MTLSYDDEAHLRAIALLGPDGGAPPFDVRKLQGLAHEGMILAAVVAGKCNVRITAEGMEALSQSKDEQVNMGAALSTRCHDTGGAAPTPESLRTFAKLLATDEDARILWDLWVAREKAAREVSSG